ncbi:MAG TPA: aminoacyl-tRNA hydrolase [Chthoniobacterales bacterium]|nr:aminoacyl-tRNA hydrolase [Chthoniobacterales bacterium]
MSESKIRLVAGLGNPGPEYQETRHNIGFMVVDRLAVDLGLNWEKFSKADAAVAKCGDLLLAKPLAFMNRSGFPLLAIAQFYKIEPAEMLVVLDDFALPLGRLRIRPDGGTGGHNGLESIIVQFGTDKIPRLRVGIGQAPNEGASDYVTGRFFEEEIPLVRSAIDRGVEAVKWTIDKGLVSAMNTFNPEPIRREEN